MAANRLSPSLLLTLVESEVVPDQETSAPPNALKISVLSSGKILLDGREVGLSELEEAFQAANVHGSLVQYTRENPEGEAPPVAEAVIKLIAANRLRVALYTNPDFSEQVDLQRQPQASGVIEWPGIDTFFAKVRKQAAISRGVSLVRPDRLHFILPVPPPGSIKSQMVEAVKAAIPSEQPRNVAAIAARGALAGDPSTKPTLPDIARRVPFFGLLIGLAYTGHAVWIFEASPETATAGCEDADVLVVDSGAIAALPQGWDEDAAVVMRNPNILVYDRNRQKIGAIRTAGEVPGRIEFPS
jgi:hypothetical protein